MHAPTPRSRTRGTNMAHRSRNPRPQKDESFRFSGHFPKPTHACISPRRSSRSPLHHRSAHCAHYSSRPSRSPSSPHSSPDHRTCGGEHPSTSLKIPEPSPLPMTITISAALRRWLLEKVFEGYIRVAEAPPHPEALDMAKKLNANTITNATVHQTLGLSSLGEKHFEIAPTETLAKYFREYSTSAKAYRTKSPSSF